MIWIAWFSLFPSWSRLRAISVRRSRNKNWISTGEHVGILNVRHKALQSLKLQMSSIKNVLYFARHALQISSIVIIHIILWVSCVTNVYMENQLENPDRTYDNLKTYKYIKNILSNVLCYKRLVTNVFCYTRLMLQTYYVTNVLCYKRFMLEMSCITNVLCYKRLMSQTSYVTNVLCYKRLMLQTSLLQTSYVTNVLR